MLNVAFTSLLVAFTALLPPAPEGEVLPTGSKVPSAIIFEWSDYGGTASTAKARVTARTARENCESFIDPARIDECADAFVDPATYTATANCQTGELISVDGRKYLFDGKTNSANSWDNGWIAMKDAESGKRVATNNAAGGLTLGVQWLTLCPMGLPYDRLPVETVFHPSANYSRMGPIAAHNGSLMFFDQDLHTIIYTNPKPSLAGAIEPDTILFRGWIILGGPMVGVAYTFKKGCPPAPYLVRGYNQNQMQLVLEGAAPVRQGCKVVGYKNSGGNARLVFDLPPD